jgi:hypothetical protein
MNFFLLLLCLVLIGAVVFLHYRNQQTIKQLTKVAADPEAGISRIRSEAAQLMQAAESALDRKLTELQNEVENIRRHYEAETLKAQQLAQDQVAQALSELERLRPYAEMSGSDAEVRQVLSDALLEAAALRQEAEALIVETRQSTLAERHEARERSKVIRAQAEALLTQATRDAGRLVGEAEKRAEAIGGEAYAALRDKKMLEQATRAMRNVVEGYGDRYIIPTHSLLDDLAGDFGHTAAGESLRAAREQTRRMVEQGEAAACSYVEPNRRGTAIRFVIDAFNGRVDAILSRVKHNNYGTLEQEIRDAYSLVQLNGEAFRNAKILPAYLDARIAELKWAVIAQELKLKEREEQRRIQEQIREEEKAHREYERAIQETAREEAYLRKAMEQARAEVEQATAQDKARLESHLADLNRRLLEAEAKNQRALSMAQQTRCGHVYIISNAGSFGEDVLKIGLTRRLEPLDRVRELGDASVPFTFDVHAMIYSEDAPTLERLLHLEFDLHRINKVNYRKEFFRLPLELIRDFASKRGLDATFTMAAEAREYRETQALEKMAPADRIKYRVTELEANPPFED